MTTDLALLADDPSRLDQVGDPSQYVLLACERAIEEIIEVKSQASTSSRHARARRSTTAPQTPAPPRRTGSERAAGSGSGSPDPANNFPTETHRPRTTTEADRGRQTPGGYQCLITLSA